MRVFPGMPIPGSILATLQDFSCLSRSVSKVLMNTLAVLYPCFAEGPLAVYLAACPVFARSRDVRVLRRAFLYSCTLSAGFRGIAGLHTQV